MKRFCTNCQKEFEFNINSMKDLDNLVCPECGGKIGAESRRPVDPRIEQNEENIGRIMCAVVGFNYMFFLFFALIGIIAYFFDAYTVLYVTTAINLFAYLSHAFRGSTMFKSGIFFIPLGAAVFYYVFKTPQSACLGVQAVFLIRHLLRDLLYTSIIKIARWGGRS